MAVTYEGKHHRNPSGCNNKAKWILSDIHATFDLLCIPRHTKNSYYRDMSANARLTLFLAQINGIKVDQPKEGD